MELGRLICVEMSSASLLGSGVCRVSGERMSHSEKRIYSIAEKEPRRVTYGASLLLLPTFRLRSPRSDPMPWALWPRGLGSAHRRRRPPAWQSSPMPTSHLMSACIAMAANSSRSFISIVDLSAIVVLLLTKSRKQKAEGLGSVLRC